MFHLAEQIFGGILLVTAITGMALALFAFWALVGAICLEAWRQWRSK